MHPTADPTRRRALELPVDQIRWSDDPAVYDALRPRTPWYRRHSVIAAAVVAALGGLGVAAATAASADPRLAPAGCEIHVVEPGDSMSRIARDHEVPVAEFIARNPHIDNPNLIYPGDELCVQLTTTPPPPPPVPVNEAQRVPRDELTLDWPGVNPWLPGDQIVDGVASQTAIVRALYNAGARGNQLLTLAAVTECESNRRIAAVGDQHLTDRTWGPSVSPWQIRTLKADTGRGTARDIEYASTLEGGADAAVQVWNGRLAAGANPASAWTCWINGHHRSFVEPYRTIAEHYGWLS